MSQQLQTETKPLLSLSASLFVSRIFLYGFEEDLTPAGHPMPAVIDYASACKFTGRPSEDKETYKEFLHILATSKADMCAEFFFREVINIFKDKNKNLVAFPITTNDAPEICVMDKSLYISLRNKTTVDETAQVLLDSSKEIQLSLIDILIR